MGDEGGRSGGPVPEMTMQHCTDQTTDKDIEQFGLADGQADVLQAGHPEDGDRLCHRFRLRRRRHDDQIACRDHRRFQFRLHREIDLAQRGRPGRRARAISTTTIEAKWLGACKADQKPGDIMMPGGMKMNIKDMEKLKALIPKQPGK